MSRRLSGQSIVEVALLAPVLILLIVVVADLGRIFAAWISVTNSAREAAYYGSQSVAGSVSDDAIRSVAAAEGNGASIVADPTHVSISYPSADLIAVTVRSPFQPIAPGVGALWGGGAPWVSSEAVFPVPVPTSTGLPITPSTPIPSLTPTPPPTATTASTATATPSPTP